MRVTNRYKGGIGRKDSDRHIVTSLKSMHLRGTSKQNPYVNDKHFDFTIEQAPLGFEHNAHDKCYAHTRDMEGWGCPHTSLWIFSPLLHCAFF